MGCQPGQLHSCIDAGRGGFATLSGSEWTIVLKVVPMGLLTYEYSNSWTRIAHCLWHDVACILMYRVFLFTTNEAPWFLAACEKSENSASQSPPVCSQLLSAKSVEVYTLPRAGEYQFRMHLSLLRNGWVRHLLCTGGRIPSGLKASCKTLKLGAET